MARGAAISLYLALGVNFLLGVVYTVNLFQAAESLGQVQILSGGMFLLLVIYVPPVVFMLVAASYLHILRRRGLVLTGAFMAFVVAILFVLASLYLIFAMKKAAGMGIRVPAFSYLVLALHGVGILLNLMAGLMTIEMSTRPLIKAEFSRARFRSTTPSLEWNESEQT
jgi:hypothetical protein